MLGFAWIALRQAREALKAGRLEEAQRLLSQTAAAGHQRTWKLLQQVARAFVDRGEKNLCHDNIEAAWLDLLRAEQLDVSEIRADCLRQNLIRLGIAQARAALEAGEPARALAIIEQLFQRGAQTPELNPLENVARNWLAAHDLAARGEFARALAQMERILPLGPAVTLEKYRLELEQRSTQCAALLIQLHTAAEKNCWREVLELSGQVLALAPQQPEAKNFRSLAWKAIEPATQTLHTGPKAERPEKTLASTEPLDRFLLWIDGRWIFDLYQTHRHTRPGDD